MRGVHPGDGFAGAEIEDLSAATEGVDARPRTTVAISEAPEAGQIEFLRAAQDEGDDVLDIARVLAVDPEEGTPGFIDVRYIETMPFGIVRILVFFHKAQVEIDRAPGDLRVAHIEQAGKMRIVVGHRRLLRGMGSGNLPEWRKGCRADQDWLAR